MSGRDTQRDITTDQRVLLVVLRMATDEKLPRDGQLRDLLTTSRLPGIQTVLNHYRKEVLAALDAHYDGKEVSVTTLNEEVFKASARASNLAYPIRFLAQGTRGTPPSAVVWELLVAALTVLMLRSPRTAQKAQLAEKVIEWTSRLEDL